MKYLVIVLLVLVLASLFSGLFFIFRDKADSRRAVKALTVRIGLSIVTFAILVGGYYFGWISGRL
jgi:hypothetical protein